MTVTVKPLEWDHAKGEDGECWTAETPFGVRYMIVVHDGSDSPWFEVTLRSSMLIAADTDDLGDAKAAAQADYEQRIRAALKGDAS